VFVFGCMHNSLTASLCFRGIFFKKLLCM
jgi:hypothetical protein